MPHWSSGRTTAVFLRNTLESKSVQGTESSPSVLGEQGLETHYLWKVSPPYQGMETLKGTLSKGIFYRLSVIYQRRQWHPTPVLLPGKSHGRRGLVGCSPWGRWGSDTTERLPFHFSLSCIGEGNGNPLQGSCLENLRDGGAWWVAVYGVAQSRTWLKWLSSSSSSSYLQSHNFLWKTNQCDLFSSCTTNLKCMPLRYVQGCWSLIGWGLLVGLSIPMGSGSATEAWRRRCGMPWCSVVENPPANAQDMGLIPGLGRFHMLRSS